MDVPSPAGVCVCVWGGGGGGGGGVEGGMTNSLCQGRSPLPPQGVSMPIKN